MRKIFSFIIALAIIFGLGVTTDAAPFLVCDEYTNPPPRGKCLPDTFLVQFNGGGWISTPAQVIQNTGNTRLHYDLSGLPAGSYTVKTKAKCSQSNLESGESTPFLFRK
jgi:hypothetical protein